MKRPARTLVERLHGEISLIVTLIAMWATGTGFVMILDWHTIAMEPAWRPALFGQPRMIMLYGVIFLVCGPFIALYVRGLWRTSIVALLTSGFVSLFLSLTLLIEAMRSQQGWLGALNYIFIAMVLGIVTRSTLRDHSFGG